MLLNINDQTLGDSSNLSEIELENLKLYLGNSSYENSSFVDQLIYTVLAESFNLTDFFINILNRVATILQTNYLDSSFEFKIFTFQIILFVLILVCISVCWKIFGSSVDHFYKNQGDFNFYKTDKIIS